MFRKKDKDSLIELCLKKMYSKMTVYVYTIRFIQKVNTIKGLFK